jgi:hypothetical protein
LEFCRKKEILYSHMTVFERVFNHMLEKFPHYSCYEITDFIEKLHKN